MSNDSIGSVQAYYNTIQYPLIQLFI